MIYDICGNICSIEADCSEHWVTGFPQPVHIVVVRYRDTDDTAFQFVHNLKADDGPNELAEAIKAAPWQHLSPHMLEKAIWLASDDDSNQGQ